MSNSFIDRVEVFLERNVLSPHIRIAESRQRAIGGTASSQCFEGVVRVENDALESSPTLSSIELTEEAI